MKMNRMQINPGISEQVKRMTNCCLGPHSQIPACWLTGLERCRTVICCYFYLMHSCAFPQTELFRNLVNCEKIGLKLLKQSLFFESWHSRNHHTSDFVLCILRSFPKPTLAAIGVKCILTPQQH